MAIPWLKDDSVVTHCGWRRGHLLIQQVFVMHLIQYDAIGALSFPAEFLADMDLPCQPDYGASHIAGLQSLSGKETHLKQTT